VGGGKNLLYIPQPNLHLNFSTAKERKQTSEEQKEQRTNSKPSLSPDFFARNKHLHLKSIISVLILGQAKSTRRLALV
jgi:hypothetical protein